MSIKIYLVGVGMGNPETLTAQAGQAIHESKVLLGAPRLLAPYPQKTAVPLLLAGEIARYIATLEEGPVSVLLSGDVGFYSGAKGLWPLLEGYDVETLPGISSLSYFCARLRTPWQDAHIVSAHGRSHNAAGEIQCHEKTFLLTGGQTRAGDICKELCRRGLGQVVVSVGERLSYPEERILTAPAEELAGEIFDDLAVMLVQNSAPVCRQYTAPGIPDPLFLRGEAPMTKEEVRALSLSKLRLEPHHILWDVGAGTGSVSVEGALAVPAGQVFAVEKKSGALELLAQNKAAFSVSNLEIVAGQAPAALADLPAPDRVFVGGSSGCLEDILRIALGKNPAARVVVNAVTLETLNEVVRCCGHFGLEDVDIAQVAVTKTHLVGGYHMMSANNPVWIVSGAGSGESHAA